MINEQLQKKIEQSIRLLQSIQKRYDGEIELAYSGGKDSDVILQLAKEAGIRYRAIYKKYHHRPTRHYRPREGDGCGNSQTEREFLSAYRKTRFPFTILSLLLQSSKRI